MLILNIAIIAFMVLETLNVLLLYRGPGYCYGNSMGYFKAYEKSKQDPAVFAMVSYLINWVAGTKIIFLALLLVVLITGDAVTKIFSVIALILSISIFYLKLYPIIKKQDELGEMDPKGYSKTLAVMIAGFIAVFTIALVVYLIFFYR